MLAVSVSLMCVCVCVRVYKCAHVCQDCVYDLVFMFFLRMYVCVYMCICTCIRITCICFESDLGERNHGTENKLEYSSAAECIYSFVLMHTYK